MKSKTLLLAGTKKGLFALTSRDRRKLDLSGPHHLGKEVNHAVFDPRSGKIHATANDACFGCEVATSDTLGKSWQVAKTQSRLRNRSGLEAGAHLAHRAVAGEGTKRCLRRRRVRR